MPSAATDTGLLSICPLPLRDTDRSLSSLRSEYSGFLPPSLGSSGLFLGGVPSPPPLPKSLTLFRKRRGLCNPITAIMYKSHTGRRHGVLSVSTPSSGP